MGAHHLCLQHLCMKNTEHGLSVSQKSLTQCFGPYKSDLLATFSKFRTPRFDIQRKLNSGMKRMETWDLTGRQDHIHQPKDKQGHRHASEIHRKQEQERPEEEERLGGLIRGAQRRRQGNWGEYRLCCGEGIQGEIKQLTQRHRGWNWQASSG